MDMPQEPLGYLPLAVVLLVAAVASVPLARALKLSAIVAYLIETDDGQRILVRSPEAK